MKKIIAILLIVVCLTGLSGCGEDKTYVIADGKCTIEITTENAANYEWVSEVTDPEILAIDDTGSAGSGADFTGYSSGTYFVLSGKKAGTSDFYLSYMQTYEGGSLSAITKAYTLTVDDSGAIAACRQIANTLGLNGGLYGYLKCIPSKGETWKGESSDEAVLKLNQTGSEEDSDKSQPGAVWQVFHFNPGQAGTAYATFTLTGEDGSVLGTIRYEAVVAEDDTITCRLTADPIA